MVDFGFVYLGEAEHNKVYALVRLQSLRVTGLSENNNKAQEQEKAGA